MSRTEPMSAIVLAVALCGFATTTTNDAVAQSGQPYAVASRTTPGNTSRGLAAIDTAAETASISSSSFGRRMMSKAVR